jgi:hypothetical protein
MSGGYIGLIWMDTDGELMKPVLWIQLRALSLSLSLSLSLFLSLVNNNNNQKRVICLSSHLI